MASETRMIERKENWAKPVPPRSVWAGNPAVEIKDEITKLDCFAGIFPHAYAWLDEKVKA